MWYLKYVELQFTRKITWGRKVLSPCISQTGFSGSGRFLQSTKLCYICVDNHSHLCSYSLLYSSSSPLAAPTEALDHYRLGWDVGCCAFVVGDYNSKSKTNAERSNTHRGIYALVCFDEYNSMGIIEGGLFIKTSGKLIIAEGSRWQPFNHLICITK